MIFCQLVRLNQHFYISKTRAIQPPTHGSVGQKQNEGKGISAVNFKTLVYKHG